MPVRIRIFSGANFILHGVWVLWLEIVSIAMVAHEPLSCWHSSALPHPSGLRHPARLALPV
eukprot:2202082-Amphidinium_carterae.1